MIDSRIAGQRARVDHCCRVQSLRCRGSGAYNSPEE